MPGVLVWDGYETLVLAMKSSPCIHSNPTILLPLILLKICQIKRETSQVEIMGDSLQWVWVTTTEPIITMDRELNMVQGATSPPNNPLALMLLWAPFYTHTFSQVDPSQHFDDYNEIFISLQYFCLPPFLCICFCSSPFPCVPDGIWRMKIKVRNGHLCDKHLIK